MASTLPNPAACCLPACDDPQIVQVPGPKGDTGAAGTNGTNGANAFTTFTVAFTMPAELGSAVATVADTSWMAINEVVYAAKTDGSVRGYFLVTAIGGATTVTLKNLEDTTTGVYADNSAAGSIFSIGSQLQPGGLQGPNGTASGAAGGDLKGTYPNPRISVGNTKGDLIAGDGTNSTAVTVGANGDLLRADSTAANGIDWQKLIPITGDANVAIRRVPRLSAATGLPIALEASGAHIANPGVAGVGALVVDAAGAGGAANARGTDAVDLSSARNAVTQVASGTYSTIGGGLRNTAAGTAATVSGGQENNAAANYSGVLSGGGNAEGNTAATTQSVVCGGRLNTAGSGANDRAAIVGGDGNSAQGQESFIGGGDSNNTGASATQAVVGGGDGNSVTSIEGSICGGNGNLVSGLDGHIGGGNGNTASGEHTGILSGLQGKADKWGQQSHASGQFSAKGDAQASRLIARNATTDATPTELFLDGAAARLTVPSNTSWMFKIMLVARRSTGTDSIYDSIGVIRNNAGTTSVNGVTTTEVYDGIGLPATPVVVDADDPNDSLRITCTGVAANNIRWVARIDLVEVSY